MTERQIPLRIERDDAYSPVQVRAGIVDPSPADFPRYDERVSQAPADVLGATLKDYEPMRVTVQSSDICQLSCPGCYVREWTDPKGSVRKMHARTDTPLQELRDQLHAMGDLQDIFFLGVEPTLRPEMMHTSVEVARDMGATAMAVTNGASNVHRYEEAFREGIEEGIVYKINISLDSIDPAINDRLRGKKTACRRTLDTIKHAVEEGDPIKINITIWPDNYHTVIDTVQALYDMGVHGFGFHCGSVEGIPNPDEARLAHIDPLAWRALCARLLEFRDGHKDDLDNFTLPFIFFTEDELRKGIIGDDEAYQKYKEHLKEVEGGSTAPAPLKICPSMDIPQVYLLGNDGKHGAGAISLCNIHTIGANRNQESVFFAHYNPETKEFEVEDNRSHNELVVMQASPDLCPARKYAMGDTADVTDQCTDEDGGSLYHGCRYVSANQFPHADMSYGRNRFEDYSEYYGLWSRAIEQKVDFSKVREVHALGISISDRIKKMRALLERP